MSTSEEKIRLWFSPFCLFRGRPVGMTNPASWPRLTGFKPQSSRVGTDHSTNTCDCGLDLCAVCNHHERDGIG